MCSEKVRYWLLPCSLVLMGAVIIGITVAATLPTCYCGPSSANMTNNWCEEAKLIEEKIVIREIKMNNTDVAFIVGNKTTPVFKLTLPIEYNNFSVSVQKLVGTDTDRITVYLVTFDPNID